MSEAGDRVASRGGTTEVVLSVTLSALHVAAWLIVVVVHNVHRGNVDPVPAVALLCVAGTAGLLASLSRGLLTATVVSSLLQAAVVVTIVSVLDVGVIVALHLVGDLVTYERILWTEISTHAALVGLLCLVVTSFVAALVFRAIREMSASDD